MNNEKLENLFNIYKNLRMMQGIVEEILTLDYYVYSDDYEDAKSAIDYCIKKYNRDIKLICSLKNDEKMVVVENDETLYEEKTEEEINSDAQFVRDCLIIIGAVKSGIRPDLATVLREINWRYDG